MYLRKGMTSHYLGKENWSCIKREGPPGRVFRGRTVGHA